MIQDRLLRRGEVEQRCGLSTSSIYRLMRENVFPRPQRVGTRAVRWSSNVIEEWVSKRPNAESRKEG